jgi:hypothetical protein
MEVRTHSVVRELTMGPIPPDKSLDELDREAVEVWKARRNSGRPTYPAARIEELLVALEREFTQAGSPDPAIVDDLLGKLRRGEPL